MQGNSNDLVLVYGMNVLKELDKEKIKKVYTSRSDAVKYCKENHIKYELVDVKKLNNMCKGNHQGVVIEIENFEYKTLDALEGDLVVILDHLEDPHNFGAIIRTCVACGVKSIIIPNKRSVKVTEVVVKTSSGTVNNINVIIVSNITDTIKKLQNKGYYVYASDMDGTDFRKVDYNTKKALVIGNEGSGVSHLVKETSDEVISIPMKGDVESLNASVAASILIYHLADGI